MLPLALISLAVLALLILMTPSLQNFRKPLKPWAWLIPLIFGLLMLTLTLFSAIIEGGSGFVALVKQSLWANQMLADLLLGIVIAFYALLPKMRHHQMQVALWGGLVICSGAIGLCFVLARILWHERTATE